MLAHSLEQANSTDTATHAVYLVFWSVVAFKHSTHHISVQALIDLCTTAFRRRLVDRLGQGHFIQLDSQSTVDCLGYIEIPSADTVDMCSVDQHCYNTLPPEQ